MRQTTWKCVCLISAWSVALCAWAVDPGSALSPACTKADPYTFLNSAGATLSLPNTLYPEWSIFNASKESSETASSYSVSDGSDASIGAGMFTFSEKLLSDESAYLALKIQDTNGDPLSLEPTANKLRKDSFSFKVRFARSDAAPDIDTLKEMYPSYAASKPDASGYLPTYTAAKLGVCVLQDGYFYVSRVRSGSSTDTDTGMAEDFVFEFCKTKYTYEEVCPGEGAVIIRIEFMSYMDDSGQNAPARSFRICARAADADESAEVCLTEKRGYRWMTTEEKGYAFDFSSLEADDDCQWFPAIDNACAASSPDRLDASTIDTLQYAAFSATGGGLYSAWMEANREVETAATLSAYALGSFEPFVTGTGSLFALYVDWAATYGVSLSDYLDRASSASLFALASADATDSESSADTAFNAFLLNMDPKVAEGTTLSLLLTGLTTEGDDILFTACAPAGASLATSISKAGKLYVRRAASPAGVASAELVALESSQFSVADNQGNLTVQLPRKVGTGEDAVEMPFLQVLLKPITETP